MNRRFECYIDGRWIATSGGSTVKTVNPATGAESGEVYLADAADVDRAVRAARSAFEAYSHTSKKDRAALLRGILSEYERRVGEIAAAVTADIGRDALESHDGCGAGVFGDLRLFGIGDVHDDPALQHLGEADVFAIRDSQSVEIRHVILLVVQHAPAGWPQPRDGPRHA